MRRIDTLNKATDLFGVGKHGWKNGVAGTSDRPTEGKAEWFNALQEEVSHVVESAGAPLNPASTSQLRTAIDTIVAAVSNPIAASLLGLSDDYYAVESDYLGKVCADLFAGTAITADCFGDSTWWGANPADLASQVAIPPPLALQNFVRSYFNTTSLTVSNRALPGTTCTQMISGTDGSGSTFDAKMAATSARIVYCNHGINDATGPYQTNAGQYRASLIDYVRTVRKYGKTPVLVTPTPNLSYGTFGTQGRAERLKLFAQVMRSVAEAYTVTLVDQHAYASKMVASGNYKPLDLFPDGVHLSASMYIRMGYNLAVPLIGRPVHLNAPDQVQVAADGSVLCDGQVVNGSSTSRVGSSVSTATGAGNIMRALVLVDEPGMDLYMAHPVWSSGDANFTLSMDGYQVATGFSMFSAGYTSAAGYVQDFETCIARSIDPGLHLVHATTTGAGAIAVHYFRTRRSVAPGVQKNGSAAPLYRRLLAQRLELASTVVDTTAVVDELPTPRLLDGLEFEFTAVLAKTSGLVVHGLKFGTNAGAGNARQGVIVGLDGAGRLTVYESTGASAFSSTSLGAVVDLSGVSHVYRVVMTPGRFGTCQVFVDGVSAGTATLTQPYWGGSFGLWKSLAAGSLVVDSLYQIYR